MNVAAFTFSCFSFFLRTSSHSLTIRPHNIHVSSSKCERLEEAEELDTSEEPLFRREPLTERRDLLSVSNNLQYKTQSGKMKLRKKKPQKLLELQSKNKQTYIFKNLLVELPFYLYGKSLCL